MLWKKVLVSACVCFSMVAMMWAQAQQPEPSGRAMAEAAAAFLASLTPDQAAHAQFAYDDAERLNWHFIPRPRKGVPLRDLDGNPLKKAHVLIQSGLTQAGYDQTLNVMSLEETLYLLEPGDRQERRERRDPRKYYLSVFGSPTAKGTWGWRLEGHHISLNFSIQDGNVVSSTPEFFGANPGVLDAGPGRSIRVLAPEEDLARQILKLCNPEQQKIAWVDKTAPPDLRGGGEAQPVTSPPVGLKAAEMSADQKELLGKLLNEYLKNLPDDIEAVRRAELTKAGFDNIRFAWWGESERNQPHNYRVEGPTFIIEYNNTQNNANHVHSMWRNLGGDFNIPVKKG